MSFLTIYFIGCMIMVAIRAIMFLYAGEITLSDLITLPVYASLSIFGVGTIVMISLCQLVDKWLDKKGKNRVFWCR